MDSYSIISYPAKDLPKEFHAFVYSKWLRSLRQGNDFFKMVHAEDYYRAYHHYLTALFSRPDAVIRLAHLSDDQDIVLGFSFCRGSVLDYVYVQKDFRRMGIGRLLVPKQIDTISHVTRTGLTIWGSTCGHWKFNPFA